MTQKSVSRDSVSSSGNEVTVRVPPQGNPRVPQPRKSAAQSSPVQRVVSKCSTKNLRGNPRRKLHFRAAVSAAPRGVANVRKETRRMRSAIKAFVLSVLLSLLMIPVFGQTQTGTIVGT